MDYGKRHGHLPIEMTRLLKEDVTAPLGSYWFRSGPDNQRYIGIMIPAHTGFLVEGRCCVLLPVSATGEGICWKWDGDENKPTLSPSIGVRGEWHGNVINGRLVEC